MESYFGLLLGPYAGEGCRCFLNVFMEKELSQHEPLLRLAAGRSVGKEWLFGSVAENKVSPIARPLV